MAQLDRLGSLLGQRGLPVDGVSPAEAVRQRYFEAKRTSALQIDDEANEEEGQW